MQQKNANFINKIIYTLGGASLLAAAFAGAALAQAEVPAAAPSLITETAPDTPTAAWCASRTCIGWVRTGIDDIDADSERGLTEMTFMSYTGGSLINIGKQDVFAVDLETDDIATLAFLYYPVTEDVTPLSDDARARLQNFMDNDGIVMIDTRGNAEFWPRSFTIENIVGKLNLRPLTTMTVEHPLARSYYMLPGALPGTKEDCETLVEQPGAEGSETVTSVIIGDCNWSGAWAGTTLQDGSQAREKSLRAATNILTYAQTGNYKADQLHLKSWLERLDPALR